MPDNEWPSDENPRPPRTIATGRIRDGYSAGRVVAIAEITEGWVLVWTPSGIRKYRRDEIEDIRNLGMEQS